MSPLNCTPLIACSFAILVIGLPTISCANSNALSGFTPLLTNSLYSSVSLIGVDCGIIPSPRFISLPLDASRNAIVKAVSPTFFLISSNSSNTSPNACVLDIPSANLSLNLCPISTGNLPKSCPLIKSSPASAAKKTPLVTPLNLSVTLFHKDLSCSCTCIASDFNTAGLTFSIFSPNNPIPAGMLEGMYGAICKLRLANLALNLLFSDNCDFS